MRLIKYFLILLLGVSLFQGCTQKQKEMKIADYAKIESEIALPDPELDKAKVENVTAKYGFTYKQYKEFYDNVQKDPALQEKLGEITLEKQKPGEK